MMGKTRKRRRIEEQNSKGRKWEQVVYIAGPITGTDDAAKRFYEAKEQLKTMGFVNIINPEKLSKVLYKDATHRDYMDICRTLVEKADYVCMLKGWEYSKGARMEYRLACLNEIPILYENDNGIIKMRYAREGRAEESAERTKQNESNA